MHARVISETDARKGLFGQGESAILMDARNALLGNGWTQGMGQIPDARNPSNPSPEHVGSIWAKPQHQIIENSNLHEFELQRPSNKGTKLLRQVIKAIINLPSHLKWYLRIWKLLFSSKRGQKDVRASSFASNFGKNFPKCHLPWVWEWYVQCADSFLCVKCLF